MQSPMAVQVSNFFLYGSAMPFGIFAVTVVSRLRFMGCVPLVRTLPSSALVTATGALFLAGMVGGYRPPTITT